jgi:hypothetical protein
MLTVTDQQPTADEPVLRQSAVQFELTPADAAPVLPLSLLLGNAPVATGGDEQQAA